MPSVLRFHFTAGETRNAGETVSVAHLAKILTVCVACGAAAYFGFLYLVAGR